MRLTRSARHRVACRVRIRRDHLRRQQLELFALCLATRAHTGASLSTTTNFFPSRDIAGGSLQLFSHLLCFSSKPEWSRKRESTKLNRLASHLSLQTELSKDSSRVHETSSFHFRFSDSVYICPQTLLWRLLRLVYGRN